MHSHEHIYIVDKACKWYLDSVVDEIMIAGEGFTLGEISALAGDFFESPEELAERASIARKFLDDHKRKFGYLYGGCGDGVCINKEISDSQAARLNPRYTEFAIVNYSHFANGLSDQNARSQYLKWHIKAKDKSSTLEQRLIFEGFALHYLTDLFTAGHIRTPRGAIFRHLKEQLHYPDSNANIVGGLISKLVHDQDNEHGIFCAFLSVAKYLQTQEPISIEKRNPALWADIVTKFHGDSKATQDFDENSDSSSSKPAQTEQIIQIMKVISISICDVHPEWFQPSRLLEKHSIPNLLVAGRRIGKTAHKTVRNGRVDLFQFCEMVPSRPPECTKISLPKFETNGLIDIEEFLDVCLPQAIDYHTEGEHPGETSAKLRLFAYTSNRVKWMDYNMKSGDDGRKTGQYKLFGGIVILEIITDASSFIVKVQWTIPGSVIGCLIYSDPINRGLCVDKRSQPKDGSDPEILSIFNALRITAEILEYRGAVNVHDTQRPILVREV